MSHQVRWSRRSLAKFGCGLLAFVFNIGLAVWYLPPVQRAWQLHQQRTASYYGPNWLEPAEMLRPRCAWLLRDSLVVDQRARDLCRRAYTNLYALSEEWALVLAARRLNGESLATILASPLGPTIVLGSIAAEADPPLWWRNCSWLQEQSGARPQGSFRMGLVQASDLDGLFGRFDELDLKHKTCLVLALLRHDLTLPESQRSQLLQAWSEAQPKDNDNHRLSLGHALEARQSMRQLLKQWPNGSTLTLTAAYPPLTSPQQQRWLRLAFSDFLGSLSYQVRFVSGVAYPRVHFDFVVHDWAQVALDSYQSKTTTERVKHTERIGKYGSTTRYEDRTRTDWTRNRQLQAAKIPGLRVSLQLNAATSEDWVLPPFGEFAESSLERDLRLLQQDHISEADWFYWDYFVKVHATQNWRLGIEETRFP